MANIRKTKKQHYVPRCYLKRWTNDNQQIHVFDKLNKKEWISNINDVASERFFYDISHKGLNESALEFLYQCGINPECDNQYIEHFFSEQIEDRYAVLLNTIIDKEISPWYEKNCFFISEENKFIMSIYLVYQYIRTKSTRDSIVSSSKCIENWLKDMNCSEEFIKKYTIGLNDDESIQGNMLFDINHITELASAFCSLTWILGVNRTDVALFTSDHPIGTYSHIKDSIVSMSGIGCKGVEVYFPLSPNLILIMVDADYHKTFKKYNRKCVSLKYVENIERYNRLCAYNSGRYVFSKDSEFSLVNRMIEDNPSIFSSSKITLSYGGKIYTPSEKMD